MKRTTLLLFFIFTSFSLMAQNQPEIPDDVKEKFKALYPAAENVEWSIEEEDGLMPYFEAEFTLNSLNMEVVFDEDGEVEEIATEINPNDLPKAALDYIKKNFADYNITEAEKVEIPDAEVIYEVEIENNEEAVELCFEIDGTYIDLELEEETE